MPSCINQEGKSETEERMIKPGKHTGSNKQIHVYSDNSKDVAGRLICKTLGEA